MSGYILVRRRGASHSEEVNTATDKYGAWFCRSHCVEPWHFRAQVPYIKTRIWSFLSLKFCRCYFDPLCKIREHITDFQLLFLIYGRSQWPRGLRRVSAATHLLGLWVRIPPGAWICLSVVSVVCCQVEVFESGWSLIQRNHTNCGVCNWIWSWSLVKGVPGPIGAVAPWKKNLIHLCQGMFVFTAAPTCTPTHKIIKTISMSINTNFSVFKHILLIVSVAVPDHTAHTAYLYEIIYEQ